MPGQVGRVIIELVGRHDDVEPPESECLLGGDVATGEQQLERT